MKIFRERAGIISNAKCWVIIYGGYMYIDDTLWKVIILAIKEWRDDKHLVI